MLMAPDGFMAALLKLTNELLLLALNPELAAVDPIPLNI